MDPFCARVHMSRRIDQMYRSAANYVSITGGLPWRTDRERGLDIFRVKQHSPSVSIVYLSELVVVVPCPRQPWTITQSARAL